MGMEPPADTFESCRSRCLHLLATAVWDLSRMVFALQPADSSPIADNPARTSSRSAAFLRERWLSTGVVVVVFVGVMGATLWPYLGQHHGSAEYDWHEVQVYLPTARTFLPPWGLSDTTTSEAYFAAGVRPALPLAGFVFSAGIVVLLFSMKRLLRAPDENASLAAAA